MVQTAILYERTVNISKHTTAKISELSPSKEPSHRWQILDDNEVSLVLGRKLARLRENAGSLVGSSLTPVAPFAIADGLGREGGFVSGIPKQRIGKADPSEWFWLAWQS